MGGGWWRYPRSVMSWAVLPGPAPKPAPAPAFGSGPGPTWPAGRGGGRAPPSRAGTPPGVSRMVILDSTSRRASADAQEAHPERRKKNRGSRDEAGARAMSGAQAGSAPNTGCHCTTNSTRCGDRGMSPPPFTTSKLCQPRPRTPTRKHRTRSRRQVIADRPRTQLVVHVGVWCQGGWDDILRKRLRFPTRPESPCAFAGAPGFGGASSAQLTSAPTYDAHPARVRTSHRRVSCRGAGP